MSNGRHTVEPGTTDVQVRGSVPEAAAGYAAGKVDEVKQLANQAVLATRIVLTMAADPALERPARAEASLDVSGTQVRAQASASEMLGAIDLMEQKLRANLLQLQDRARTRHRWIGVAAEQGWRRGTLPTTRSSYFPRPPEDREIVRRKTFATAPMTPDEAAYDMGVLGHDFYLFTDSRSGKDAVVYRGADGGFAVHGDAVPEPETAPLVDLVGSAPSLTEQEAVSRLDLSGEPFVFFLDQETGRGHVLYMRYDGHYGLITAA